MLAESFERIHRFNLIGMGMRPLQSRPGEFADSPGRTGEEVYSVTGMADAGSGALPDAVAVRAQGPDGTRDLTTTVRIDSPAKESNYRHGGILQYVLRQLLDEPDKQ